MRNLLTRFSFKFFSLAIMAIGPIATNAVEIDVLVMYDSYLENQEKGKPVALTRSVIEQGNVI